MRCHGPVPNHQMAVVPGIRCGIPADSRHAGFACAASGADVAAASEAPRSARARHARRPTPARAAPAASRTPCAVPDQAGRECCGGREGARTRETSPHLPEEELIVPQGMVRYPIHQVRIRRRAPIWFPRASTVVLNRRQRRQGQDGRRHPRVRSHHRTSARRPHD